MVAVVTSVWFGSSFWGAVDTAFCRIYHMECRTWLRQKRFALVMLVVVLLFMAATVLIPTAQSILVAGANGLPFGLKHVEGVVYAVTLGFGLFILFGILCVIYWAVPNERMGMLARAASSAASSRSPDSRSRTAMPSVSMPGPTQLARTPKRPSSTANARTRASIVPLGPTDSASRAG